MAILHKIISQTDKIMIRKIFLIINIIISLEGVCQPRNNGRDKYSIICQSEAILNPIGWSYSTYDEKWCGYYGICLGEYKRNSKTPRQLTANDLSGYGDKGIYSLHITKVKADDRCFYLLYHIYWDGEYDYPTIEVGWHYYKSCSVWVITEEEYRKLSNLKIGINTILLYDYTLTSRYLTRDGKDFLKSGINNIIASAIKNNTPNKPSDMFVYKLYVKLENDNKTIRFQLPTNDMLWEDAQKINAENEAKKQSNKWFFYTPISEYNCVNFADAYFEVSKLQFDKLIIK